MSKLATCPVWHAHMPEVSADVKFVEQAVALAAVGGQVMMSVSRLRWNRERSGGFLILIWMNFGRCSALSSGDEQ